MLIGKSSVPLCVDALKGAVNESRNGTDVDRYLDAWECIRVAAPNAQEAIKDESWVKQTRATNKEETTRLEEQLKGYRNNLIKESIRVCGSMKFTVQRC